MSTLSSFLGTNKPQVSIYGQRSALYQAKPDTAQVLGAYVEDAFKGEGTLSQDTRANEFEAAVKQAQDPYTEDEWKKSEFYRPSLKFTPGMDAKAAEVLSSTEDDRNDRQMIMEKASGWQKAGGISASLATGIFEPKNLATGVAAGILTGGLGEIATNSVRFGKVLKSFNSMNKYKRVAAIAGTEGAVAAALSEPSNRDSSKILQGDYTMTDTLLNFGLSTVLSGAAAAGHLKYKEVKLARKAAREEVAVKQFDAAISQLAEGRAIDVDHVAEFDNAVAASQAAKDLPQITEKINNVVTETGIRPVTESPEFKNWFGDSKIVDEAGAPQVLYHGTSADIHSFEHENIKRTEQGAGFYFTDNPEHANIYSGGEGANIIPAYVKMDNPLIAKNVDEATKTLREKGININNEEFQAITAPDMQKVLKEGGYDGLNIGGHIIVQDPGKIKSVFNRGAFDVTDPRLHDVKKLNDLQVQKGKAEAISKTSISEDPINRAVNETSRPDNSTAYNPKDSQDIKDFVDSAKVDKMQELENNLEQTFATIQEMRKQGLLSKEEIAILDELANIETGTKLHDDILTNAYMCLTRG